MSNFTNIYNSFSNTNVTNRSDVGSIAWSSNGQDDIPKKHLIMPNGQKSYTHTRGDSSVYDTQGTNTIDNESNVSSSYDGHHHDSIFDNTKLQKKQQITMQKARSIWKLRVYGISFILLLFTALLLWSKLWFANIFGVFCSFFGIYGTFKREIKFLLVFITLATIEWGKNIGLLYWYWSHQVTKSRCEVHCAFQIIGILLENIAVLPIAVYSGVQLYRLVQQANLDELRNNLYFNQNNPYQRNNYYHKDTNDTYDDDNESLEVEGNPQHTQN